MLFKLPSELLCSLVDRTVLALKDFMPTRIFIPTLFLK
uniref:Uncharacterized protein n=1 Tax=Arundo donax TaxID=35708 RepID=A0A0A9FAE0_ARUDO